MTLAASWPRRFQHFSDLEMRCKCGCGSLPDPAFMAWLEQVRQVYGKPMVVTSGARCEAHNRAVGGEQNSAHCEGMAVDIAIRGAEAMQLVHAALISHVQGIGLKQHGADRFVHLDRAVPIEGIRPRPWIFTYP